MELGSTLVALFLFGVVKVAVMVLAGVLLVRLLRAGWTTPVRTDRFTVTQEDRPALTLMLASLIAFAVSELVCGLEVYVFMHATGWVATIHSLTSALGMALLALGALAWIDRKLLRFGQPGCLLNRVCQGCTIERPEGCRYRRLQLLIVALVLLTALPLLFAPTERMFSDAAPWALPFDSWNAWYDEVVVPLLIEWAPGYDPTGMAYSVPPTQLVIEFRLLPLIAMGLTLAALVATWRRREVRGQQLVVAALGVLAYSWFQAGLYVVAGDVLLGSLGHEVVELWFLVAFAEFLRRSFPPKAEEVPIHEPAPPVS